MTFFKEPRRPKVGEVWVWITNSKCNVLIKYVDSDGVYYKFNEGWGNPTTVNVGIQTLQGFLETFSPPKPKPREVWIQGQVYADRSVQAFIGTEEELLNSRGIKDRPWAKWKKFREVLEDEN